MSRLDSYRSFVDAAAASAAAQNKPMIQKLSDEWSAAFNKGDSHALAELYTEDAYVLPAGGEMVHGRQAIQGFWDDTMKQLGDGKLTTVDVQPLGPDAAREIGTFSFKTKGNAAAGHHRKVRRRLAQNQRSVETCHRHLEHEQVIDRSASHVWISPSKLTTISRMTWP